MASPASAQSFQNNDIIPAARNKQSSVSDIQALASNSRIIWGMIAAMSVAAIVAYRSANLSFAWSSGYKPLLIVLLFLVVSCCYRKLRPDPRIIFSTEGCAQLMIILSLGCALSYPLAITGFPYQDAALHSVDTWMGLDWRTYLHFVNARPVLCVLSELAYRSMILQFLVLIVTLVATSRFLRLQQYILATASALAITLVIFAFVPAGGTYAFLHIPPSEFANLSPTTTADQMVHLDALRAGQHTVVSNMEGLITFPSFHTVWAALFMWGFFPIRELRFGAIFLNLFVIASTPIQGAHYFIDLIGGVIVAVIAICAAVLLTRHAPRWPCVLGSIIIEFVRRTQTTRQAGGGRGTGVEPSPRRPAYSSEVERMAERAELGSNILSHDLARVGTIPAYHTFWQVDGNFCLHSGTP